MPARSNALSVSPRRTRTLRGPIEPAEARAIMLRCDRFIAGHGVRGAATMLATIDEDVEVDHYGSGGVVSELESRVAQLLGKQAALFLISGTMAQQAVLRIYADRSGRRGVVFHPSCHLDVHEERAYERLHQLVAITVGAEHKPLTRDGLDAIGEPVGSLLIELPQRHLGGTLPEWDELVAQCAWARERGAAVHLDGARLFESGPYYQATAGADLADVAALFDSVYVSFYKGLGGLSGCCVAGDQELIDELRMWRARHGGRVYALWPYAASSLHCLELRGGRFGDYHQRARRIAQGLRRIDGIEVLPYPVTTNMMHVRISGPRQRVLDRMMTIARDEGVWMFAGPYEVEGPALQRFEYAVGDATMAMKTSEITTLFQRVVA